MADINYRTEGLLPTSDAESYINTLISKNEAIFLPPELNIRIDSVGHLKLE